jgi:16S rRNA (guanine966-N2)-methyltransferase
LRVIAGSARGVPLRVSSKSTRPISDRGKESLFNILAPDLLGVRFLDLFAGTGGVGIEALSRGADHATFVERSRQALSDIEFNLAKTHVGERARIVGGDVFDFLRRKSSPFNIVFVGPPQWLGLCPRTLHLLDERPDWIEQGGIVVTQHDPREDEEILLRHLAQYDARTYGGVRFTFYKGLDEASK